MKIKIRKVRNHANGDLIYETECFCGMCLYTEDIPKWFECPLCKKKISLFKKYVKFKGGA